MAGTGPKPYVFSIGSALKHIEWMEAHLDAKIEFKMMRRDAPDVVEHASVQIHGGSVYLSDRYKNQYGAPAAEEPAGLGTHLSLSFTSFPEGEAVWKRLTEDGKANVIFPYEKQAWGAFYGVCQDSFGTAWALSTRGEEKKDGEPAEKKAKQDE